MKRSKKEQLIDDHLKNRLSEEDRHLLNEMLKTDPEFAILVKESEQAFQFLRYVNYQELKEKLRAFDKKHSGRKKFPPKQWILFLFLLITIFIASKLAVQYYSPEKIARRNFDLIS